MKKNQPAPKPRSRVLDHPCVLCEGLGTFGQAGVWFCHDHYSLLPYAVQRNLEYNLRLAEHDFELQPQQSSP